MKLCSKFVSVVSIMNNDCARLEQFVEQTLAVLGTVTNEYELLLVDDASTDQTASVIDGILARHECVRYIRLSRGFGIDIAVTAGLDAAIGDYTVVMVAATDPPDRIPDMLALANQGADIVIGVVADQNRSWLKRAAGGLFAKLFRNLAGFQMPEGASTMRLFSRKALNALTRIRQKTVHLRILGCSVGYRTATLPYQPVSAGRPIHWITSIGEAASILVTHSPAPLRLVSWLGGFASLLNVAAMLYVAAAHFWKDKVVEGWTTLSLQMSVMFLFLFTTLIVVSEYLAHAFEEVKDCPLYHVADEKTSSTAMSDARRRNISRRSTEHDDDATDFIRRSA
jgi:dolichol-phosphate mannosyltransferase